MHDIDHMERAISTYQHAVSLLDENDGLMAGTLDDLGTCLKSRFERLGELDDLNNSIWARRCAVNLTLPAPARHREVNSDLKMRLYSLGHALNVRFERLGELGDIEEAISHLRFAVNITFEDDPDMPNILNVLGICLKNRFRRLIEPADINSAILALRRAVELTPERDSNMSRRLNNLGALLNNRYEVFKNSSDLEEGTSNLRRAVALTPEGHPNMPGWLGNLGLSLSIGFRDFEQLEDMDSTISTQRRALELTPEGHPSLPGLLGNLGLSLGRRFLHSGDHDDLDACISALRRVVELAPDGYSNTVFWPQHLATALFYRFRLEGNRLSFNAIVHSYKEAALQTACIPPLRLQCAGNWASLEASFPKFGSSASLLQAHACVIETLPEIIWLGHTISRRYQESAKVAKLVNDAVSAAIKCDELSQAVEWLEAGRGLIWSQVLSLRTPVDDLAGQYPLLAEELQELSDQLKHTHLVQLPQDTSPLNSFSGDSTNQHRGMVIRYETKLKEIRACPGFENFLRPQKLADLASMVEHFDGPLIFINTSTSRCDALVLSPGGAVKLVILPDLTRSGADELRTLYAGYLRSNQVRQRASAQIRKGKAGQFLRLLSRLWTWIVHPILKELELMNPDRGRLPHITWCPTGPLMQLPLHAAGIYRESGPSGPHVYDFVVSSYTPSLLALVRAQRGLVSKPLPPSVLVVTQSATPGLSPLPGTVAEGARVQEILSESQIESEAFSDGQATVESIEVAMRRFPWVHFACHGVQDEHDPTQSAFALYDGKLTLSTLMKTVADGAELAFLSACQTASGDEKVPEESAHLTAGMLAVGFKGVVGTMWSIGDADAPVVVEAYYKRLLRLRRTGKILEGSTGAAYALHEAVKVLRERVGETSFVRWVPFVHYGV